MISPPYTKAQAEALAELIEAARQSGSAQDRKTLAERLASEAAQRLAKAVSACRSLGLDGGPR